MTDLDRLKELLDGWQVPYEMGDGDANAAQVMNVRGDGATSSDKVTGYCGFYTCFEFDREGKFLRMGAWE